MARLLAFVIAALVLSSGTVSAGGPLPAQVEHSLSMTDSQLDEYVGKYASSRSGISYDITKSGHELEAQITGQLPCLIFASRPDHFFYTTVRAYIQFIRRDGHVVGLVLTQYYRTLSIPKLSGEGKPLVTDVFPEYPPVVALDERTLDQYAGTYDGPRAKLTVAANNGHLFAQISGQEALEIYPSSSDDFYYKAVDALVHFNRDGNGKVISLLLTQDGYAHRYTLER